MFSRTIAAVCSFLLVASCTSSSVSSLARQCSALGRLTAIEHDALTLVTDQADTLRLTCRPSVVGNGCLLLGDSVLALYADSASQLRLSELILLSHSAPTLTNASAMLVGTWRSATDEAQFVFAEDCSASLPGSANQHLWALCGAELRLADDKGRTRVYNVVRLDAHSLTLVSDHATLQLAKVN